MTQITITNDGQVTIDGQLAGRVADTIANNPKLASDIQRAYDNWHPAITKEAADCRANAATLQAQVDSLTKQLTDAKQAAADAKATADQQITDLTTKLGALPKFVDDLQAAAGGEDTVQALIDGYKQQQAKQTALVQGGAVIDQLIAIGLTPSEISQAVADKLSAPKVIVEATTSLGVADAPASTS